MKAKVKFQIIRANESHRKEINRLLQATRISSHRIQGPIRNFWMAKVGDRFVGCAGMDFISKEVGVLTHLAVEKEYRHNGIGAALVAKRFAYAKQRGVKVMTLITMYYRFNFYKRRGFRTIPRPNLPVDIRAYAQFTAQEYMKCAVMINESVQDTAMPEPTHPKK
jgi:N-acetylglutamate synthase-like GNAT family acetyltransferase